MSEISRELIEKKIAEMNKLLIKTKELKSTKKRTKIVIFQVLQKSIRSLKMRLNFQAGKEFNKLKKNL